MITNASAKGSSSRPQHYIRLFFCYNKFLSVFRCECKIPYGPQPVLRKHKKNPSTHTLPLSVEESVHR